MTAKLATSIPCVLLLKIYEVVAKRKKARRTKKRMRDGT
jgi:hypothetical protein